MSYSVLDSWFPSSDSKCVKILKSLLGFLLVLGAFSVPARAQSITIGFEATNYAPLSFGRQVSINIEPIFTGFSTLSSSVLVVTLPPGVNFVASTPTPPNITTVTSISGSSLTGEVITLAISPGFSGGLLSNFQVIDNVLTVSVGNSVSDGTILQATFDLSGTISGTTTAVDSGPFLLSFQAGYLPVSVSAASNGVSCRGQAVGPAGTSSFSGTSGNAQSDFSNSGESGQAALVSGSTGFSSTTLQPLGDISGPGTGVALTGIGGRAFAYGGFALSPDIITMTGFFASSLSANATCDGFAQNIELTFSNPNPYSVPLSLDERSNVFLAAGNGAATNPFGFPSSVSTNLVVGNGNVTDIGSGVATSTISKRLLFTPGATTLEVAYSIACFPDGQSICDLTPPSDTTQSFPGSGGFVVSPGVSNGPFGSFEFPETDISASGASKIATDATTGDVTLIRTGYGSGSGESSIRIYRGDADLPAIQSAEPAKLVVSGSVSPTELLVTDPAGHRTGFQAAPNPPPQFLDAQPSVLTEIFGASYSGLASQPQVISIPDPDPQQTGYTATITGTGTGSFTLTMQTQAIDGTTIDSKSFSGNTSAGSTTNVNFTVQENGTVVVQTPSCATDVSSSVGVTRSGFSYSIFLKRYGQALTLTNSSASPINGPIYVVLDNLSSNATLHNSAGKTACAAPLGSPYVSIPGPLNAGASATVPLQFTDPTNTAISYTTRVLAGPGQP